ncbi:MAG: DUF1365 domain-containing protein [Gammaproteobacteria bacterium]|nr:DUF1365 domain-containing protein [Gammaproteobacteria bacterium]
MSPAAWLYAGEVMHRRLFPVDYRFSYRVFSLLLDVDRLDEAGRASRLFSHNRFNLVSFHDADHGPRDGTPLRPWIDGVLRRFGIDLEGGPIALLCLPRVLGFGFNPLAIWYCRHRDGSLRAVLLEVSNTFGERHGYLLHDAGAEMAWPVRKARQKEFHVSPFVAMEAEYRFRLAEPAERLEVGIREFQSGRLMLVAAQVAERRALTTATLARAVLAVPLQTFKVLGMIHWQALKIWLRGAPFHRKPAPPAQEVS